MEKIRRSDIIEDNAWSGIVEAGDFVFVNFCVGNVGKPIEDQINGALDHLEKRLKTINLTLDSVVKLDCMFRDIWDIPIMEKIFKDRFNGKFPARKSIQTEFAHIGGKNGLLFQLDAIAYKQ